MKLLRIILTILVSNILVLLPAEKSFASEFNTWEENFQQCVIEGAKEIYIYIVVDESGSLESYFVNNPTEGSPKDPKTDNGLPLRARVFSEQLRISSAKEKEWSSFVSNINENNILPS